MGDDIHFAKDIILEGRIIEVEPISSDRYIFTGANRIGGKDYPVISLGFYNDF